MSTSSPHIPTFRRLWFWLLVAVGFFLFLYLIRGILLPFVVGIFAAYFLDPAADKLEEAGCSRTVATGVITVSFFLLIILFAALLVPTLVDQLKQLAEQLPSYYHALREAIHAQFAHIPGVQEFTRQENLESYGGKALGVVQQFLLGLMQSGLVILNLLSLLVITPIVSFFLLRDWDNITAKIDGYLPKRYAPTIREQLKRIDQTLAGYIRGQVHVMLALGVFYAVGLSIIGLDFAILVGMAGGLLVILPYLGVVIAAALSVGIAYVQFSDWQPVALVAGFFVLGQMIEGYVLTPKLVGDRVGLHPLWLIFGMLAGGALFGFVGVLLAIPVSAVLGVLVRFALQQYLESDYYNG